MIMRARVEVQLEVVEVRAKHGRLADFEDSNLSDEKNGRHEETRTPDLYRVNFEVNNLKPFPYLAFPHMIDAKRAPKQASFDGELMASFPFSLTEGSPTIRSDIGAPDLPQSYRTVRAPLAPVVGRLNCLLGKLPLSQGHRCPRCCFFLPRPLKLARFVSKNPFCRWLKPAPKSSSPGLARVVICMSPYSA